jgi:hypothetical protein
VSYVPSRPRGITAQSAATAIATLTNATTGVENPIIHALGNAFAVLVRELLDELPVLQQRRAARSCGHRVLLVRDRCAGRGRHRLAVSDGFLSTVGRA